MMAWYYETDGLMFFGFFEDDDNRTPTPVGGPFKTFSEAKRDAIRRFECDVRMAREALREVREARKPKTRG
jgi:hypothetical protein